MIRVAQLGWDLCTGAETVDDVKTGVGCYWVEINGVRIARVISVEFKAADDEFTLPRLVVDVADGFQVVYVGEDGEPLPGAPVDVTSLPEGLIDHKTAIMRDELG